MSKKKFESKPYRPVAAAYQNAAATQGNTALAEPAITEELTDVATTAEEVVHEQPSEPSASLRVLPEEKPNPPRETETKGAPSDKNRSIRVQVDDEEKSEIEDFIRRMRKNSDSPIGISSSIRILMAVAQRAEDQINHEIEKAKPFPRPSNSDAKGKAELEQKWIQVFGEAFRKMTPIR